MWGDSYGRGTWIYITLRSLYMSPMSPLPGKGISRSPSNHGDHAKPQTIQLLVEKKCQDFTPILTSHRSLFIAVPG